MRWHSGRLRGDDEGAEAARQSEHYMRAQGIARPAGWARMLAPGFAEDAGA